MSTCLADQTRAHDETATKHFVSFTRARSPSPSRGLLTARRNVGLELGSLGFFAPHSHSIINKPSKLLIYKGLATDPKLFTVTFTVNLI